MSFYGQSFSPQIDPFDPSQWRLPLSLAIAVHIVVFLLLIFPPTFFLPDREIPEVQTINLFTVDEFKEQVQPPRPKPQPPKPQAKDEPPPQENLQSIAIEPPAAQPTPTEVISLRPRRVKKKIIKEEPKPAPVSKEEILRQKALERIQARVNQKVEEQKLKHDLSRLRDALHSSSKETEASQQESTETAASEQSTTASAASSSGTNIRINEAQRRYFIAVQRKILDNWALPKTQEWDSKLEAIVVIYIEKSGVISKTIFEKKSKNVYFNQYVEKTIQAASPMPPVPSDLKKSRLEIGLRFRPSGLF